MRLASSAELGRRCPEEVCLQDTGRRWRTPAHAAPGVWDDRAVSEAGVDSTQVQWTGFLAAAAVAGLALALTARAGALALLVAVAALQALLAASWVYAGRLPGRKGALLLAAAASAAADVAVSVWPHGKLGALLPVLALAVPLLFVHQLARGAARSRVVASLGSISLLVLAVICLPALLQLRHEFGGALGGHVVSGVAAAAAGGLVVACLVDLIAPMPRFDPDVPRGLLGVLAAAGLGGSLGYLLLQSSQYTAFIDGRGAFIGGSLGALVALLGVGIAFVQRELPVRAGPAGRLRPVLAALAPLCFVAPIAFLLCLAIRA
jgi:hypothetical protein